MDYTTVAEATGSRITREALSMLYSRYAYSATFCNGKDVLEVACGSAGLGYLVKSKECRRWRLHRELTQGGTAQLSGRIPLLRLDAHVLPFRSVALTW
jgi:hypothetical protein